MSTLESIRLLLREHSIMFKEIHHEPTFTSEQSAKARGEDVNIGGKALVMKVGDSFKIFVLSAALRIDSKAVKKYFKTKDLRFATKEELLQLTGLVPGSVPPFGRPLLSFDLYADNSVIANDKIAFNSGSLTDSIVMSTDDWKKVALPEFFSFSQE